MPAKPPPGPTQVQISSDEEFEQIAGSSAESGFLCVVEVFASWCGATDAAVSTIARLNADFSGRKLRFYQVNADRVTALERFKAKSKPNFLLFKDVRHLTCLMPRLVAAPPLGTRSASARLTSRAAAAG